MKLWKYIHYSEITKTFSSGAAQKEPYVWALTAPDSDYDDITTDEKLIEREVDLIKQRKEAGIEAFQQTQAEMRVARLASGASHSDFKTYVYDNTKGVIDNMESGDWLNAYSEADLLTSNIILTSEMIIGFKTTIANYIVSGMYDEFVGSIVDSNGDIV